jgi:hypothetical protein
VQLDELVLDLQLGPLDGAPVQQSRDQAVRLGRAVGRQAGLLDVGLLDLLLERAVAAENP